MKLSINNNRLTNANGKVWKHFYITFFLISVQLQTW